MKGLSINSSPRIIGSYNASSTCCSQPPRNLSQGWFESWRTNHHDAPLNLSRTVTFARFIRDGCEAKRLPIIRPTWPQIRNTPVGRRQTAVVRCSLLMACRHELLVRLFLFVHSLSLPSPGSSGPRWCRRSCTVYTPSSSPSTVADLRSKLHQYSPIPIRRLALFSYNPCLLPSLFPTHALAHTSTCWSRDWILRS